MLIGIILLIYGLSKGFFGYKMYRISLFFAGFCVGAVIGGRMVHGILLSLILGLILGIVTGVLAVVLLRLGVFLQCAVCAFMAVMVPSVVGKVMALANVESLLQIVRSYITTGDVGIELFDALPYAVIIGIIVGVLGLIFTRLLIIFTTALLGGIISGIGLCMIIGQFFMPMLVVVALVLLVAGTLMQIKTTGKTDKTVKTKIPVPEAVMPATPALLCCSRCGAQNEQSNRFCAKCGNQIS